MPKYKQLSDNEWTQLAWNNQKKSCCGCGLTHVSTYEVVTKGKQKFLYMKPTVDNRATGQIRRHKK